MELTPENKFKKLIVVGDRVLIKPKKDEERTKSGLYLPPGVKEKEQIQSGYIIKAGPGYPIPMPMEEDEPWKDKGGKCEIRATSGQGGRSGYFRSERCHRSHVPGGEILHRSTIFYSDVGKGRGYV
jgi:hypothetical protein